MISHLYIHIPFCPNICPYCAFYKESAGRERVEKFLEALLVEVESHADQLRPETIFLGGGTPSALSLAQLEFLFEGLHRFLDLSALREWTIEMNPATVAADKAKLLREAGINRISMGVQSWDDPVLKTLGRTHTAQKAEESFHLLRDAGFKNISIDLIFGVPGQSLTSWQETLERSLRLDPEHLSAYGLTYEEDTEFFRLLGKGFMKANEHLEADQFEMTTDLLSAHGYEQYEVSNYAKNLSSKSTDTANNCVAPVLAPSSIKDTLSRCAPSTPFSSQASATFKTGSKKTYYSLHNTAYWLGRDYLGLGPSAFSTVAGKRWRNIRETGLYTSSTMSGQTARDFEETLSPETLASERAAFGLRTHHGLPFDHGKKWQHELEKMESHGLLYSTHDRWLLTRRGKLLADTVGEIFV